MNTLWNHTATSTCKKSPDLASQICLDESDHGVLLTAESGRIESANPTFCRWIGYTFEELHGMRIQQLLSVEARTFHQMYWQPLMALQGAVANVKFDLVHHAGFMLPMMSSAITCTYSKAIVHELTLFNTEEQRYTRDLLTARLLAERCLAKNLKAQRALLSRSRVCIVQTPADKQAMLSKQMLGIVSHDLRTPLLAISMAAELLGRHPHSTETLKLLGHISHSVARAQRLVADVLDFTLIQSGRGVPIHPTVSDLPSAVEGCLEELRLAFPRHQLTYNHVGQRLALFDKDRLFQVIGNLVANAIAYGDPQSPVSVRSCNQDKIVVITVHNMGAPIPAELLERLFEPLVRGQKQPVEMRNAGLGLFIVSQIAKAQAGRVSVISTQQDGTTFSVTFSQIYAGTNPDHLLSNTLDISWVRVMRPDHTKFIVFRSKR